MVMKSGDGGDNTLTGTGQDDTIEGKAGNDRLYGLYGADILLGGEGDDLIDGGADKFDEEVSSWHSYDTVSFFDAQTGITVSLQVKTAQNTGQGIDTIINVENVIGSAHDDVITGFLIYPYVTEDEDERSAGSFVRGGEGNDTLTRAGSLYGEAGDDLMITYGTGRNLYDGGDGSDTVSFINSAARITATLGEGGNGTATGQGTDTLGSIENLTGSAFNDVLTGNTGANRLAGAGGDDRIDGGGGIDTLNFAGATHGVAADLRLATAQDTGEGLDTILNMENIVGGDFGDRLTGNAGNNRLEGGAGDDTLDGGGGSDGFLGGDGVDTVSFATSAQAITLDLDLVTQDTGDGVDMLDSIENATGSAFGDSLTGNGGDNWLDGGAGDDWLDGSAGTDTASYASAGIGVRVDLSLAGPQDTGNGADTLARFENLSGSAYNDVLKGDGGNNRLSGQDGDDTLWGGGGDDVLEGGAGSDTASFLASAARVTVDLTLSSAQATGEGLDTLAGIENATGSAFDDILTGNDGDNVLDGGAGDDILTGGAGKDTASYASSANRVVVDLNLATQDTGNGTDTFVGIENLTGSAFDDILTGDASGNVLDGGAGIDILNGGLGFDTASYAAWAGGVAIDMRLAVQDTGAGTHTFISIENLTGSAFDDILTGNNGSNTLSGGGGKDRLDGGTGADRLYGGAGDDLLISNTGSDIIDGGEGVDTLSFAATRNYLVVDLGLTTGQNTGDGTDTISAVENLIGTAFDDRLTGDGHDNRISGGAGNDWLDGGAGIDTLDYAGVANGMTVNLAYNAVGEGADTIRNFENVIGSAFDDVITGDNAANVLDGGNGDDLLYGGAGNNRLVGGAGDDILDIANGSNTVIGGDGFDLISFTGIYNRLTIDLNLDTETHGKLKNSFTGIEGAIGGLGADTITGNAGQNRLDGYRGADILAGGAGDDSLRGGDGKDTLYGGDDRDTLWGDSGDDILFGGEGDDILSGGKGADSLDGGAGRDTISFAAAGKGINVSLARTTSQGTGEGNDTLVSIENVEGSGFNDAIYGDKGRNRLDGGDGNDRIDGGASDDELHGGYGDDLLIGSGGSDVFDGGAGIDTLSFAGAGNGITVKLYRTAAQGTKQGTDTISEIENVIGSAFNDVISGSSAANVLDGGAGDDILSGRGGKDVFIIGAGHDRFIGGTGTDTITGLAITVGLTIDLAAGTAGYEDETGLHTVVFSEIESVIGSEYDDVLAGNAANNRITGSSGDDILTGGGGRDTFVATQAWGWSNGSDTITDFSLAEGDRLDLSAYTHGRIMAALVTQSGSDTLVDLGDGSVITLTGVDSSATGFMSHIIW